VGWVVGTGHEPVQQRSPRAPVEIDVGRRNLVSTLVVFSLLRGVGLAQAPIVMIPNLSTRYAVERAVGGAMRRLEKAQCQKVLDEFADTSGATLRTLLSRASLKPTEFLSRLRFAEGNGMHQCRRTEDIAAFTVPGNRVIFICGSTFEEDFRERTKAAQMIIIHEMLHAAGLGENPPTSREITARVTKRCGA
jgi:hypothetical protein